MLNKCTCPAGKLAFTRRCQVRNHSFVNELRAGQCRSLFRSWRTAPLLLCILAFSSAVFAQLTTADILGTVTDSTGAVIPNANVKLLNVNTHEIRTATSNASGDYVFPLLNPGHYSISVQATGFEASRQILAVEAGDRARADFHMTIGSASQTVMVEAQTPLLQSEDATVSSTVTEKAVQDLPLNGRNFVQLVQLVPGANEGLGNGLSSGARPDDRRQSSAFTVNGQDSAANNYLIDGIDNNERIIGTIGVKPSVEGIQEISIQTNSYAPEAGRTAGGVTNLSTKSGTDAFHGTVFRVLSERHFRLAQCTFTGRYSSKSGTAAKPVWRQLRRSDHQKQNLLFRRLRRPAAGIGQPYLHKHRAHPGAIRFDQ